MILSALALACGISLTSCKDDTQPRLQTPAEGSFKVFEPALNNYTYVLDPSSVIELVTSQPEYGLGTVTQYQVQMSLDETFTDAVLGGDGEVVTPANYRILTTVGHQAKIQVKGRELAVAYCSLNGINVEADLDKWTPAMAAATPMYVRVFAYVVDPHNPDGIALNSGIYSNVVKLNSVKPYLAINVPAQIWLVGKPQGWNVNSDAMPLDESEAGIDSNIYSANYLMVGGSDGVGGGFRFYKELGQDAWGEDGAFPSIGSNANDGDNLKIDMSEDNDFTYEGPCVAGKGNWNVEGWPVEGKWMKLIVDLNAMSVSFKPGEDPNE